MWWIVALALAQSGSPDRQWARFSASPARRGDAVEIRVGTLARRDPAARLDYWFQRRLLTRAGVEHVTWTDSRRCPAARPVLGEMADIRTPRFRPPGFEAGPITVIGDGTTYALEAPAVFEDGQSSGGFRITSNVRTSLARWVDDMLAALESCWASDRPSLD